MAAAVADTSRSGNAAELQRMFSNLDSSVIESVLAANDGQVNVTIDHLLTMSIDTENENSIQQVRFETADIDETRDSSNDPFNFD
jgi:hypothetical protein